MWTLGRKLAAGFALSFALLLAVGVTSYRAVEALTSASYAVAHSHDVLDRVAALLGQIRDAQTGYRGYVITGNDDFLEPYSNATGKVDPTLTELRTLLADNRAQTARFDELEPLVVAKMAEFRRDVEWRRTQGAEAGRERVSGGDGERAMDELRRQFGQMERAERDLLDQRADDVETAASTTRATIIGASGLCALLVTIAGVIITRGVGIQVGTAVRNVESSSAELQAAANQQLTGTKEQVAAMNEIATTINELLATSRQIAESAQRVAQVAGDTARSAKSGDGTVDAARESIGAIRRQVDVIVAHMLDLGKKSQQIGTVLDIVSELAEQTNILAINATIEAAGAGESGKRFGVVADEIRKLADRVADSTKEIRGLIDDVRAAVNTTVMATEGGSKAVDAGSRQFGDVTASFKRITDLVGTTTEASREIELSTKQQTTAVEQVKVAIANVGQASRDSEASSGQTLQTALQLTALARDLLRIVEAHKAA